MMPNYLCSQCDAQQIGKCRDASLQLDRYPAQVSNNGNEQSVRTEGSATLADSSVASLHRSRATAASVASRSQAKVAGFHMINISS